VLPPVTALLPGPARRALAQRRGLAETAHRPWPVPEGRWVIGQSWNHLLFAHWPIGAEAVRRLVPEPLVPDLYEGHAYVGVVPFRMETVRFAWCPPVAGTSSFAELNVRTYVTYGGKPGVLFVSLDVGNVVALEIGRRGFGLPYFRGDVRLEREGERVNFRAGRQGHRGTFAAEYGPAGPPREPQPGTLEHWLTERYCFYTVRGGNAWRTEVHHPPWQLQPAESNLDAPIQHFSRAQDVVAWNARRT
jgi:uncharacterized protein YqjF (DUF2071 family)